MKRQVALGALLGTTISCLAFNPAAAAPLGLTRSAVETQSALEHVAVVVRRAPVVVRRAPVVVRRAPVVVRPAPRVIVAPVAPVRWARPAHYWWRPAGAIAAGAAIGFVTAATAASWAGAAPGPGMCWYYSDPSYRTGFWDVCP